MRCLILAMFSLSCVAAFPATLYVDASAPAGGDGSSWSNAYSDLQAALNVVQANGVVCVAQGTYKPTLQTSIDPRSVTFQPQTGDMTLKGGYVGRASATPDARDFDLYPTILSGDLNGDDDTTKGLLDAARNNGENARHVVTNISRLDGLRVGYGNNVSSYNGVISSFNRAGVVGASTIENCILFDNVADEFAATGAAQYKNSVFRNNFAKGPGGAVGSGNATGCIFEGNDGNPGGAAYGSFTAESCIFRNNKATRTYVFNPTGGAIHFESGGTLKNCVFVANQAGSGGALFFDDNNNTDAQDATIANCVFYGNSGGAIRTDRYGTIRLNNSICWNNGGEVVEDADSFIIARYSCISGGFSGKVASVNIMTSDPQFVNAAGPDGIAGTSDDNFQLQPGSPCIDAGENANGPGVLTDFSGNRRIDDDAAVADAGSGTAPIIDMGAYERAFRPLAAADAATVLHGKSVTVSVLANDISLNNGTLSMTGTTPGAHGTAVISGNNVVYSAASNFSGIDTFTYTISAGAGLPDTGTVTVTVTNKAPVASSFSTGTHFNTAKALTLTATDGDGDAVVYGIVTPPAHGTLTGTAPNVTYTPAAAYVGSDSFTYKVNDGAADSNTATVAITVANAAPKVAPSASPASPAEGDAVLFQAGGSDADGDPLSYRWDFGDGTTSTDTSPVHAFAAGGVYTVSLTVSDGAASTTAVISIKVYFRVDRPIARFTTSDVVGFVDQPLAFDATFSTDKQNAIIAYSWDFGDGSPKGAGQQISRAFAAAATYVVTLNITDADGLVATTSRSIVILPADQIGLFNSFISYKVKWDRNKENADSLNLEAIVNVGDAVVQNGTAMALEIAGQRFEGALNGKLQSKSANLMWQVVANTKKQAAGEVFVRVRIKKASLGLGFNLAGAVAAGDDGDPVTVDIPVRLEIAGRVFEVPIESEFKFSKDGKKASGEGEGP